MIKKLIEDLATDKVTISTALSIAKVIAKRIKVEQLSTWINNELNGYALGTEVPHYRRTVCEIKGDTVDSLGRKRSEVIVDLTKITEDTDIDIYSHHEAQSVQNLEFIVNASKVHYVVVPFPQKIVNMLPKDHNVQLLNVYKTVAISDINNIFIQVKQRLLDLLLEIECNYPETSENEKPLNAEEISKVNTMITYNVYGNQNTVPLAVGTKVKQKTSVSITTSEIDNTLKDLSKLGIETDDLSTLRKILEDDKITKDKPSFKNKCLGWIGKLATTAAEKGIELQLPQIIERINQLIS